MAAAGRSSLARAQGGVDLPSASRVEGEPGAGTALGVPMLPEARALYDRGLERYAARDFEAAIRAFEAGHGLEPRREFLFAEAQAFRLQGDCDRAAELYRRFLATDPPAIQVEATQLGLARCAQSATAADRPAMSHAQAPPASPPTDDEPSRDATSGSAGSPVAPASSRAPSATPPPSPSPSSSPLSSSRSPSSSSPSLSLARRWMRDPFTVGTGVGGLLALGTGIAFWAAADQAHADALSSGTQTYDAFSSDWQKFRQRRAVAIGSLSAGTALLLMGATRAWWLAAHHDPEAVRIALGFDGHQLLWSATY